MAETDIAIIGMTGRFPGADDIAAFWRLLREGQEGITRFSRDELEAAGVPASLLDDGRYVPAHGVIPDAELFDTAYFEFTPAEAQFTDPQHRILLTAGHAALENAGYDPLRFDGLISAYAGAAINTYLQQQVVPTVDQTTTSNHFAVMVGNDKDFLATRLAYKLDLKGPAYTVQTACSTSLVAIHLACQGLIAGECDMALAGGVTIKWPQTKGYLYEEGAILSNDGHVRTFDADASGTVLGNGVGVLVLKPLGDALRDRDTIHAVIKGTATNNDGSGKVSFAAPGAPGQTAVIREAHMVSGVPPRSLGYVEAHGTATRLGDPVEVSALTRAFRESTPDRGFCAIGSVKSNVGHLDAAAGVAGVIKTVLMMKHRALVPTVNFQTANPAIDFDDSPFRVSTETAPWRSDGPLRAGVSSFGIGGTNAHAVLEESPEPVPTGPSRPEQILVVSARTPTALRTAADELADYLEGGDVAPLADVAFTLAVGRRAHEYRIAVRGGERNALADALRAAEVPAQPGAGDISFVFGEDVADAAEIGQRWCEREAAFAEHWQAAWDAGARALSQPGAVFALQYALGRTWLGWGLEPAAIHGDGVAALAAACVAETLTLAEAMGRLRASDYEAPRPRPRGIPTRSATEDVRGLALGVEDGLWQAVARAWAHGAPVDWNAWFAGEERGRVPLPTYPFEGRRCWMKVPEASPEQAAGPGLHPMLDENVSTLDTMAYRSVRTGGEFYLADHRIDGEPVMPAVGYLEMARAGGELATGEAVQLRNVAFDQLLSYAPGPRATEVSLFREPRGIGFEIIDESRIYASGRLHTEAVDTPPDLDLDATSRRCGEVIDHQNCYAALKARGLDYGPRMRALSQVALGDREALGTLALPEGADLPGALLNPALLDGALHALVVLLSRSYEAASTRFLPLALDELNIHQHQPWNGTCQVHVRIDEAGEHSALANLSLVNGDGRVLARLHGLAVRVLEATRAPSPQAALWVRQWENAPAETADAATGPALVIAASEARRAALTGVLGTAGIDGTTACDFETPLESTNAPATVVVDEPEPAQALAVVQELLRLRPSAPVRVLLVHREDATGARPERAALAAFARTVRTEAPLLAIQTVGLADTVDEMAALSAELRSPGTDTEVRYAPQGRQVRSGVEPAPAEPAALREGGVYIVSGGAGGLGRTIGRWLAEQAGVQVVLLGRGAPPPDGLGERVTYRRVDVSDAEALPPVLAEVRTQLGPIRGVIHAAGALRDSFALHKTPDELDAVLTPKVAGLRALDAATSGDDLDFFVSFSSIAAHVGNAGQCDYAYANACLEAYAERSDRMTAIAWPMWAEGGMRQTEEAAADIAERTGFGVLPTETGLELLQQALGTRGAVIAAYGDEQRMAGALTRVTPSHASPAPDASAGQDDALYPSALRMLRELLAAETGLERDELTEDAPFERYGIDSLMITKLNRELERRFDGLSKTLFFEYTTLQELAGYFAGHHADALRETTGPREEPTAPAPSPSGTPRTTRIVRRERIPDQANADDAIAIVGMAGRYPMADDLDEFWANLAEGRDCIQEIPPDRWDSGRWFDPDPATPGRAHTRWGGFLRDVDRFDPLFFGISPRQAELMDPQERLFLQTAWHAMEDAGYRRADLSRRTVGVYAGVMYGEYQFHGALDVLREGGPLTGSSFATIANRVSYALDLSGPSMALDTMCSSSLTAIHLACESLRRGESELALAGGVNVSVHPYKYAFLSQGRFLSSDGRCRAFGAGGDGYVPGEGVGVVLLKPRAQAIADGDRILGVILGSAINHGARTHGYTVPSPRAQQRVISTAMEQAGVSPEDIGYIEAHGTGTSLGDPIEITGLTNAYASAGSEPGRWAVGSVKSNVGHLESAAGMAGLTKVVLQLDKHTLVPSLHADELNPNIDFARSPFRVQRERAPWPDSDGPRRAGLSSFGAGGANAHLVVEESPVPDPVEDRPAARQRADEPVLLVLSAKDDERLRAYAAHAADFLEQSHAPLRDLAYTMQVGREAFDTRLAVLGREGSELVTALRRYAEGGPRPEPGDGELATLAERWLSGSDVDFAAWHASRPGPRPRRVRAPLFPFARERYWIPLKADFGTRSLHPLIDANDSTVHELRFRKTLRANDPFVRDHVIEGRGLLAGAAVLEMVRAAAGYAEPSADHALKDVVWGRPIDVDAGELTVYVAFAAANGGLRFEVYSEAGDDRVTHARGQTAAPEAGTPAAVDLDAVRTRLARVRERDTVYADYNRAGFAYGPSFQVIEEVFSGPSEALLQLRVPVSGSACELPPAVLDGALRACHWVGRSTSPEPGELAVPFSLGALEAHGSLPETCYAYARFEDGPDSARRFSVSLHDGQGRVLAVVRDFVGRTLGTEAPADTALAAPRLYEPCWLPAPEPAPDDARGDRTLVVLGQVDGLASALTAGGTWNQVVEAPADADGLIDRLQSLATPEGFDLALVGELAGAGRVDATTPASAECLDAHLNRSCQALLQIVRAVDSGAVTGRVRAVVVHAQDQGADRPEQAAVAGFAQSMAAIHPRVELATLGLPAGTAAAGVASALAAELGGTRRAGELETRRTASGTREVRSLRPAEVGPQSDVPLRTGGVYVLTGGHGAIGRVLAEHLARHYRARLVLLGRSEPDEATARWHEQLTGLGAEVLALRADVSRAESLEAALQTARRHFDALNGVFHLAGAVAAGRATDADPDQFAAGLAAKALGVWHLDWLTREDDLDAFVIFSSISSLIGDFGTASYAIGNRFADLFAVRRDQWVRDGLRKGRSLSLAWPLWDVGGVDTQVTERELATYARRTGMGALTAAQGLAAFDRSLTHAKPWLVPAHGEATAMDAALLGTRPQSGDAPVTAAPAHTPAPSHGREQRAQLVDHLREALSSVLKLPPGKLDSRVPLEDYGFDSVLVMDADARLGKDFPGLTATVFFDCRTVDALADHILERHADDVARLFPAPSDPAPSQAAPATPDVPRTTATVTSRPPAPAQPPGEQEPIAIIGVSGRYPQADDLDELWANLAAARDAVTEIPRDRWDANALFSTDPAAPGHSYGRWGGFISDVDAFDSLFFQIAPKQARSMDPQERLFLETAWAAMENAGYPPSRIPAPRFGGQGHDAGVFVGVMWDDYAVLGATESARGNPQVVLANRSSIANQVSYFGDFRGPSVVTDTACSASLVALHQACESIRRGECRYAIAGGVNVSVHPDKYVHLSRKSMLASDGRCRAFGAGGSGYVPGEGVGAVMLKRLSEAVEDGDTIHAVIKATAVNHGGRTSGYTVPNPRAQQALVEQALATAGVDARTIGCVEAHGTGTELGDPIEHDALAGAFGKHTQDTRFCALGSIKSAIGHLEGAAGIAGLTKAVLQLRHRTLLPTLHAETLNPVIDFERSPFVVPQHATPWRPVVGDDGRELPRRAAVSSFGAGGTNAHVILEEYPAEVPAAAEPGSPELIVLSARDEERLRVYAARLAEALRPGENEAAPRLADVAYTLRVGREPLAERLAFVAHDLAEAAEGLAAFGRGEAGQWLHRGRVDQHPPLATLFREGAGSEAFLAAQIEAGEDDMLARLWVSGVTLDWDVMHRLRPGTRRRVPLPTYPFERVRHWLDLQSEAAASAPPRAATASTSGRDPWRKTLAASAPVLRDHVVDGRCILPGVGHLDLVAEACGGLQGRALTDVRWIAPLAVGGRPVEARVRIDGAGYEVLDGDGNVCSRGQLSDAPATPASIDLSALRARLHEGPGRDEFYAMLEGQGLPYGPFFRRVTQVWTGQDEVLGRIEADDDNGTHPLHPGVLDAALHIIAALLVRRRGPEAPPMLPFAVDRVEVFGPVPTRGFSHVRETARDRCDVTLVDDAGHVRVRLTGLTYRESRPAPVSYRAAWRARPATGTARPARRVLLMAENPECALAHGLVRAHDDASVARLPVESGLGPTDLDRAFAGEVPDLVYFLASDTAAELPETSDLQARMERGAYAFYHLVRALDRYATPERRIGVKVVTTGVYPLEHDDASHPGSAALPGLAMVAGKEFPNLEVAILDVRADESRAAAAAVATEPFPARTVPVSLRGGVRRERVLEAVELGDGPSRFRHGGVYLIVGGLGAVGRDTCRHLARTYRAKLVIVGRSPLDERRREALAELEAAGAEVRYIAADATVPAELEAAVRQAKEAFGALHGVIHAAMVLINRPLQALPENELGAALDAKAASTLALLRAIRNEPLDFALFYSSGVVFEGNYGQAGYAAGCTFADAYALHEARTLAFPVRVLNLGYWHAGGDEERERVLRRVRAAGIRPLSAARGMAVVERMLRSELPQVLALDAEPGILDNLGVQRDRRLAPSATPVPAVAPRVRFAEETLSNPALTDHQRATAELERLSPCLLADALARLGLFEQVSATATPSELAERLGIVSQHRALFELQLDALVEAGFLERQGGGVRRGERDIEPGTGQALAQLVARHPSVEALASLLQDCLSALPDILTGRRDAMEILFPDGSPERVAALYEGDPVTDLCNAELARLVVEQVEARRRAEPHRRVRVLEVGAGTGGSSAVVLEALRHHGDAVEYVFTDISPGFVRKGRGRFAERYPFARFEALDIEKDPSGQIGDAGNYDVVLATNVVHATRELVASLRNIRRLLRGDGVLLLNEGTRAQHQLALIFGLTSGWWLFTDGEYRLPHSPLASERQWRDVLSETDFERISAGAPRTEAGALFQSVIAAVADGLDARDVATAPDAAQATPPRTPPAATPAAAPSPAGAGDALEQVTSVFARVLEMQPEQLDPDLTFENYGVDSLVALELTRGLEEVYGPLPSTLLFEQITMRRVAEFCGARATPTPPAADPAEPPPPDPAAANPETALADAANAGQDIDTLVENLPDDVVDQLLAELLPQDQPGQENPA